MELCDRTEETHKGHEATRVRSAGVQAPQVHLGPLLQKCTLDCAAPEACWDESQALRSPGTVHRRPSLQITNKETVTGWDEEAVTSLPPSCPADLWL